MSLLIPTASDWRDAHANEDADEAYRLERSEYPVAEFPWRLEPLSGFFKQLDPTVDDMAFNYALEDFGIAKPWPEIVAELTRLNASAPPNVKYKLLFLARHGQGVHNTVVAKYSSEEWHSKWKYVGTDGELVWGPDPDLTQLGVAQAKENNQLWKRQLELGAPKPTRFYVSPLQRSINTLEITWDGIDIPTPEVLDLIRETIGIHLCHKRPTKSEISAQHPQLAFEPGFPERDIPYEETYKHAREQFWEQFLRADRFLQRVFENDDEVVDVTCHAGMIRAFITVLGHRKFTISTGGQIPVIVKGERRI